MITIGGGCGSQTDRLRPARRLLEENLDYLILECAGSVSTTYAAKRAESGGNGYTPLLKERLEIILPKAAEFGTTIVTNAGVTDPAGAGKVANEVIKEAGLSVQVIIVSGDDCLEYVKDNAAEYGEDHQEIISANAYIGAEQLVGALEMRTKDYDAHLVIGGRIADPSLVVAPMVHEFDWELDDWDKLGKGTVLGHLIECGPQSTGGFFSDPPRKVVPDLPFVGYPYVEVDEDGNGVITKPDGTGGIVEPRTVKEQLFYEVHDPSGYITPDVVADFSNVVLEQVGTDRVKITGGTGKQRPEMLKVLVGKMKGYKFENFIPFGGPNAVGRAEVFIDATTERLDKIHGINHSNVDFRFEIFGRNALYGDAYSNGKSNEDEQLEEFEELLVRVAGVSEERELLEPIYRLSATTLGGPASTGVPKNYGGENAIMEKATIEPIFLPRAVIDSNIRVEQ